MIIKYISAFQEVSKLLLGQRYLCYHMSKREITDRYSGQFFGSMWALVHPAFVMVFYAFIFGYVFKIKAEFAGSANLDYTSFILSGLIPWLAFAEVLVKSATVITSNINLVKQFSFPLEVLSAKSVFATLFSHLAYVGIYIGYALVYHKTIYWTFLLVPVIVVLQIYLLIGASFVISTIGVFFKDLKDFLQIFNMIGIYILPVIYFPGMVPPLFEKILYFNPASYLIWCYQDALFYGRVAHPVAWIIFPSLSIIAFVAGYMFFRRFRPLFGGVL